MPDDDDQPSDDREPYAIERWAKKVAEAWRRGGEPSAPEEDQ
ncbi:hypothetical protein PO878_04040 [Iamia majanohamensis]|uniref:Uncharacterized protein n=1 Tax=Iamia majanohamensis TaxID=467976 RepID=A0AAE9YB58_9ACTN|nr:hypothetical protein [Iamia majanohamensis]WCO67893.1 hypothetical protein PO878_04040 [Iamia majanohamensis]